MDKEIKKYIMKRTEILCPNCFKKKIIEETEGHLYCDECGQRYVFTGRGKSIKFKDGINT